MIGLRTKWGEDTYTVAAETWDNAAAQVCVMNENGEWIPTGYQVADFVHNARKALRRILLNAARLEGMDEALADKCATEAVRGAANYIDRA